MSSRLAGHALLEEGRPFNDEGQMYRWNVDLKTTSQGGTVGRAKCECGTLSEELNSTSARQRWHRQHKDEIRATLPPPRESSGRRGRSAETGRFVTAEHAQANPGTTVTEER